MRACLGSIVRSGMGRINVGGHWVVAHEVALGEVISHPEVRQVIVDTLTNSAATPPMRFDPTVSPHNAEHSLNALVVLACWSLTATPGVQTSLVSLPKRSSPATLHRCQRRNNLASLAHATVIFLPTHLVVVAWPPSCSNLHALRGSNMTQAPNSHHIRCLKCLEDSFRSTASVSQLCPLGASGSCIDLPVGMLVARTPCFWLFLDVR
ncbi:hypothetical protein Hypma_001285 [Hypsizygus marmoreus]|uniref:Uncharacterized protein n=1 Tax=Hypsizygus marmoreus TaxID=39966 RepID=A0A369K8B3_HYPMA|nr:hypothetical protein Hypma_001285 [Hypsizygus marmoreus]